MMMKELFNNEAFHRAIKKFSQSFYANTLEDSDDNYISSPLGAWVLLAVLAGYTDFRDADDDKENVKDALGMEIPDALQVAESLLSGDDVDVSVQVWSDSRFANEAPRIKSWLESSPHGSGDIPSQEELNEWVQSKTNGLIKEFPIDVNGKLFFLLAATVIYTKFSWEVPYKVVDFDSDWGTDRVLFDEKAHVSFYKDNENYIVAYSKSDAELHSVCNVMSLTPDVPILKVLEYAHELCTRYGDGVLKRVSYAEVFAAGIDSNILEMTEVPDSVNDSSDVHLPAWEAKSDLNLNDPALGFYGIADVLSKDVEPGAYDGFECKQSAFAKYDTKGFEAAAVTAFSMMRASAIMRRGTNYHASVKFVKPYASLCHKRFTPLFAAVVNKAMEPSEE